MNPKMLVEVRVKTGTSQLKVEKFDSNKYFVWLNKKPTDNEANEQLVNLLKDYFNVAKSNIVVVKGLKSHTKLVKIDL